MNLSKFNFLEKLCFSNGVKIKKHCIKSFKDLENIFVLKLLSNLKYFVSLQQIDTNNLDKYFLFSIIFNDYYAFYSVKDCCIFIYEYEKAYVFYSFHSFFSLFDETINTFLENKKIELLKLLVIIQNIFFEKNELNPMTSILNDKDVENIKLIIDNNNNNRNAVSYVYIIIDYIEI